MKRRKSRAVAVLESSIQETILAWLQLQPWCDAWREYMGPVVVHKGGKRILATNPNKGFPDIQGVLSDSRMFVIECKSASGSLSPEQRDWRDRLRKRNVLWVEARSLEDVIQFFRSQLGSCAA